MMDLTRLPPRESTLTTRQEATHYLLNRNVYEEIRKAYLHNYIDRQQLKTLRGQVKAGDADGAMKGLGRLLMRGHW